MLFMFSLELFCFISSIEWIWWFNVAIVVCECVCVFVSGWMDGIFEISKC